MYSLYIGMGCDYYICRVLRITHALGVAYHRKSLSRERVYCEMVNAPCNYSAFRDCGAVCCFCGQSRADQIDDEALDDAVERRRRREMRLERHSASFAAPQPSDEAASELLYEAGAFVSEAARAEYEALLDEAVAWCAAEAETEWVWDGAARAAENARRRGVPVATGAGPLTTRDAVLRVDIALHRVLR